MYPKHIFYKEIRMKQGLSYISFYQLRFPYNRKFIQMATSLGTNDVVVARVCVLSVKKIEMIFWEMSLR